MSRFLWVTNTKENRIFYSDCSKKGLRLHFEEGIDRYLVEEIRSFIRYLRKQFFFPYRCHLIFVNTASFPSQKKGYRCSGIFFSNQDAPRHCWPQIHIATHKGMNVFYLFSVICHELTHYFQWYFFDDTNMSAKGAERQATNYANRIVSDYYNTYQKNHS